MNKLLVAIMLVGALSLQAQVSVKSFTLGQTSVKPLEKTTLGGISVGIVPFKLNDGRIYDIAIIPSDDGVKLSRVYQDDVDRLKYGFETHYKVKFIKHEKNSTDYILKGVIEEAVIYFIVEENEYMDPPIKLTMFVTDPILNQVHEKEARDNAASDF
jgi:hypothetical protein